MGPLTWAWVSHDNGPNGTAGARSSGSGGGQLGWRIGLVVNSPLLPPLPNIH